MAIEEEKIKAKIEKLKVSLENVQANANAHIGAIKALEELLKPELKVEEKESIKEVI